MSRPQKNPPCGCSAPLSKRDSILLAAQDIFLEVGYSAASMDAVAARANVSKATIYAHFANKRALFEAMIGARCARTFGNLPNPGEYSDARETLRQFGEHFLSLILSPEALAIHRVVLSEATRQPEVGEAFYFVGPVQAHARIGDVFRELVRHGQLAVPDYEIPVLASLFMAMLKSDIHTRAVLNLPPSAITIPELVDMAVEMVVSRYGVK